MDHQHALRQAVDHLGTKPHPLRFFRADRAPSLLRPTRALLALHALSEGMTNQLTTLLPTPTHRSPTTSWSQFLDRRCTPSLMGQPNRSLVIAGFGPGRILVFADSSILFARQEGSRLVFWPGVAHLRSDGPRSVSSDGHQGPWWGVAVKNLVHRHHAVLQLAEGMKATKDAGAFYYDYTTWNHEHSPPQGAADDQLAKLRTAIDAIDTALGAYPDSLSNRFEDRGTRWPLWLPYREVSVRDSARIVKDAIPALQWLLLSTPSCTGAALTGYGTETVRRTIYLRATLPAKNPHTWRDWQELSLDLLLAQIDSLDVQHHLKRLNTLTNGVELTLRRNERIPHIHTLPAPDIKIPLATTAHARMQLIARFGPPPLVTFAL